MDVEIRPVSRREFDRFALATERAFGAQPRLEDLELDRALFEPERSLAAFDGEEIVGTAGAFSLRLTVPGGTLPMAGVTAVGVSPTHRRRGILTAMMRRQLDDLRASGEPLAGLWASEAQIYHRFGYGLATFIGSLEVETARTAYARPYRWDGRVTLVDRPRAMAEFPAIHDRVAEATPGMWARTREWWEHDYADREGDRGGASPLFYALYEGPGGPEGYAAYRIRHRWEGGLPQNVLRIHELVAATAEATAALWRFCFDHDLVRTVEAWARPADEPLLHMLANPRALRFTLLDGLWLRLVDVPTALASRCYATEGRLALEVRDEFCPWNEGRYLLDGGPDGATCERTDQGPDLVVGATDLGAAFLGGNRLSSLARAGRVNEQTPGALALADAMFCWDPSPWCPNLF